MSDWRDTVRVGDVLVSGRGTRRVVRDVHHAGPHVFVTFTIRRCSWTGRCTTVYNRSDLRTFGYRPTGERVRLRSRVDLEIARNIKNHRREQQTLDCCEVRGVP